ncbi:hypothetical protein ACJIZ3_011063 [Penstemon smallii]|uniref:SKP1 component dimerisation domain-containing protein n=1 Tax=Penstemon smallii TaxID=265156 RepID=A0ABD3UKA7_9LAMI
MNVAKSRLLMRIFRKFADLIKDISVEECRTIFNTVNDFTEGEKATVRNEYPRAFENINKEA